MGSRSIISSRTNAAALSPLRVAKVERLTRDAIAVSFDVPAELHERYAFVPGQFLALEARIDGETVRRSYSICSTPEAPALRVAIKRVPGGRFSTWAHDALGPGETLGVAPPSGRFGSALLSCGTGRPRHDLAVAAGSGITPILAIVSAALARDPQRRATLVYGNRGSSSVMFREEILALKDRFLERFSPFFVMSREPQEIAAFAGRLDRSKCDDLFATWVDAASVDGAYVCGPAGMRDAVVAALESRGLARDRIAIERFAGDEVPSGVDASAPGRAARGAASIFADASGDDVCRVSATIDGRTFDFPARRGAESVLDAGLRAGIDLPYSCKGGVCATCRAVVTSGEVDMDVHYALEDYEIARGAVLLCQSYAATPTLDVDIGVR